MSETKINEVVVHKISEGDLAALERAKSCKVRNIDTLVEVDGMLYKVDDIAKLTPVGALKNKK